MNHVLTKLSQISLDYIQKERQKQRYKYEDKNKFFFTNLNKHCVKSMEIYQYDNEKIFLKVLILLNV